MPTREQVLRLLDGGLDYEAAGQRLGIPPGQAYLIATGVPADGSDTITGEGAGRPGLLPGSQHLASPPYEDPAVKASVAAWLKARAGSDEQMAAAQRERTARQPQYRIGMVAAPYSEGRGGMYRKAAQALGALGAAGAALSGRSRVAAALSGVALLAASAATRWGIFHAGLASAGDPAYTVVPQRQRLEDQARAGGAA